MKITVDFVANTGKFETDTKRARSTFEKQFKQMERDAVRLGKAVGIAAAGIATSLAFATARTIDAAREVENFARISNTSAQDFQRLAFGAETVGIQSEKLADIFKDVQDKVGDFLQTGGGPLADFFENIAPQVGVTAEEFRKLSGPDALQLYFDSLEQANVSQADMVFYLEAIASDATNLIPLLRDGGKEFKNLGDRAEEVGAVLDKQTLRNLREVDRQLKILKGSGEGLVNTFVAELAPSLVKITRGLNETGGGFDIARKAGELASDFLEGLVIIAAEIATAFEIAGKQIGGFAAATVALAKAPFGEKFEAVRGIADIVAEDVAMAEQELERFKESFRSAVSLEPEAELPGAGGGGGGGSPASKKEQEALQKKADAIQKVIDALGEEIATNGLSIAQLKAREVALLGGTQAQQEMAFQLGKTIEQQREYNEAVAEAESIFEATRTPIERLQEKLTRLNELLDSGKLDWDTYSRAVFDAQDEFDRLTEKVEEDTNKMSVFAEQAARNMQDAFADFLFDPFEGGLEGLLNSFEQTLRQMAAQAAAAQIFESLGFGEGGGGFDFGSILDKAGGFLGGIFGGARADGGPVMAGKTYLVGEQGPELFVSGVSGTIVPNHEMGGMNVVNNFSITSNGPVTRQTEQQIAAAAFRGTRQASQRNN